jgi:YD repeat-containing protein
LAILEMDDFVEQAKGKLPGILADAVKFGEDVINEIAKGIEAVAFGNLDVKGDLNAASARASAAVDQFKNDPLASFSNVFGAAASAYKAAGKGLANSVAQNLVPDDFKKPSPTKPKKLRAMSPELRTQLSNVDDKSVQNSIGWLLFILSSAVTVWRKRNAHGQSTAVHPDKTDQAKHTASDGQLGSNGQQAPAKVVPNPKKGPCECATDFSINFAFGSESLNHTDFSLPGQFPIEWTRTYNSRLDAYDQSELGARWISEFDCMDEGLTFYGADGRDHSYPLPKVGLFQYDAIENITLDCNSEDQLLPCRGFQRKETYVRRDQRYVLSNISLSNGAGVMLHYEYRHGEHSVLSDLITYQENDISKVHLHLGTMIDDQGRFIDLWQIVDGEPLRQLCAYQYDVYGDLIQAQDENGAVWSYQFQHHLITRCTDRTGRGMNLQWDGPGAKAKAIPEWADDGSFDSRLEWDENIRLTYVTDELGNDTWHYYDILGYTYRIRHADERSEWFFRDDAKNIVRRVNADGSTDRYMIWLAERKSPANPRLKHNNCAV